MIDAPRTHTTDAGRVLLTGATGLVGQQVLLELLEHGHACTVLVRPGRGGAERRLAECAGDLLGDIDRHCAAGRLRIVAGGIEDIDRIHATPIASIVHVAACTSFDTQPNGDPWRTNVEGTRRLLAWATAHRIGNFHLVSSAFRCGIVTRPVAERIDAVEPEFHNDYEASKWHAEAHAAAWARSTGGTLTVYRPSVVVGDSRTGRASAFRGFYLLGRAAEIVARAYDADDPARHATGIRITGDPDARQNLVSVDWVARLVAHAVSHRPFQGRVYHLTHPEPPTCGIVQQVLQDHFDVGGSTFIRADELDPKTFTDAERMFHEATLAVRPYLWDIPTFDRSAAAELEAAAGMPCPPLDAAVLHRLLDHAVAARWGRKPRRPRRSSPDDALVEAYFAHELAPRLARSRIARMHALSLSMRFELHDVREGHWVCRFESGRLVGIERTTAHRGELFTYTTGRDVFFRAIAGDVHPQQVFLDDEAQVRGDVEAALKMAMILHQFNRELPCTRAELERRVRGCDEGRRRCISA